MKAVHCLGNCQLEVVEVPRPAPRPGWALLRMCASAICGSDLHGMYERPEPGANTPGHEFVGEVVEVESGSRLQVGQRVAAYTFASCGECPYCLAGDRHLCAQAKPFGWGMDGADADYVLVPEPCCFSLPDWIPDEVATLIGDVIGVPWHQLSRVGVRAHELMVVSGLGPLGLGSVIVGKYLGCRVVGIDVNPYRVELAAHLGADAVLNAARDDCAGRIAKLSEGRGLDVGLECAGRAESLRFLLDHAAKRGRICLIGENHEATFNPSGHFLRRDLTLFGSTYFNAAEFQDILRLIQAMPQVPQVITHRFPLSQAAEAFARFREGKTGKVVLVPDDPRDG